MSAAMPDECKLNLFLSRVISAISANMTHYTDTKTKKFRIKGVALVINATVKDIITKLTGTTLPEHVTIGYIQAKRKRWYVVTGLDYQSAVAVVTKLMKNDRTSCKLQNVTCVKYSDLDTYHSAARLMVCFAIMNNCLQIRKPQFDLVQFAPKSVGRNQIISIPIDKFVPVIKDDNYYVYVGYPLNVRWMTWYELDQCLVEVTKKEHARMLSIYKEYRQKNPSGLSPAEERHLIGCKSKRS